ncbi:hypothetical protein FKM82_028662 [Ascaphus truei]
MKFAASLTSWALLLIRGHRLFSLALVLLFCSAAGGDVSLSSNCKLVENFRERYTYYSSGDIMLAGLLQFGDGEKDYAPSFEDEPMYSYRHRLVLFTFVLNTCPENLMIQQEKGIFMVSK